MRPLLRWSGAALAVLSVSVLFDTWRAAPAGSLPASITRHVASAPGTTLTRGAPVHAAALLQAKDCTGNLRVLHLLNRASVRDNLTLSVIWYVGPVADSTIIRSLLPSWTAAIPLRPVPTTVKHDLARLGHTSTPLLVVLDQEGRVRFTSQSPRSSREFAGLRRIIEGLTWFEER